MAQQAPLTPTQLPNDSILDINGRQTYLGNSFTLPAAGTSLTDTSETPMAVIKNTAGAAKSFFLFNRVLITNNNPVLVRFYLNPTLNVPGATTTPKNLRTGSTLASIATCYLAMTITANGALFSTFPASTLGTTTGNLLILDPGSALLLTGQQAGAGTTLTCFELAWYEI